MKVRGRLRCGQVVGGKPLRNLFILFTLDVSYVSYASDIS